MLKSFKRAYGWRPDSPDFRDLAYARIAPRKILPNFVDLRPQCPPILNQETIGSCTSFGIGAAIEFDRMKQGLEVWNPSHLFIYFLERDMEGTIDSDSGAQIRDGIKAVASCGAPPETLWPYDVSKYTEKPPQEAYDAALLHKAIVYSRLDMDGIDNKQLLVSMRNCLANGFPFVGGFTVYESFEDDKVTKTGIVPLPSKEESVLGGHCVLFTGYNDDLGIFNGMNSWGTDWGDSGFFTIPQEYITNTDLASDFWQISIVQ